MTRSLTIVLLLASTAAFAQQAAPERISATLGASLGQCSLRYEQKVDENAALQAKVTDLQKQLEEYKKDKAGSSDKSPEKSGSAP